MKYNLSTFSFIKNLDGRFKKVLPVLILLVLVLIASIFIWPLSKPELTKATLILDLGGQKRAFEGDTFEGMTILDALNISTKAGNIDFTYAIRDDGINILTLNGPFNGSEFLLNSKQVDAGQINKIPVKAGDKIEIKVIN